MWAPGTWRCPPCAATDLPHTNPCTAFLPRACPWADRRRLPRSWRGYPPRPHRRSCHGSASGNIPAGFPTSARPARHHQSVRWGRYDPKSRSRTAAYRWRHGTVLWGNRSQPRRWPCLATDGNGRRYTRRTFRRARCTDSPRRDRQPRRNSPVPTVSHDPASSPYPWWNRHATPASRRSRHCPHHVLYRHTSYHRAPWVQGRL